MTQNNHNSDKSPEELRQIIVQLEEKLRRQERDDSVKAGEAVLKDILFASLINSPNGLLIWEERKQKTRVIEWNRASERIFGWSRDEMIGKHFFPLLFNEYDTDIFHQIVELFRTNQSPHNYQNECQTKSGKSVRVNWFNTPIYDKIRKRWFILSLIEDITDRAIAEESLFRTTRTYRALVDSAPLSILIIDQDRNIELINPAAEILFGWKMKTSIDRPIKWNRSEDQQLMDELLDRVFLGQLITSQETELVGKKGKHFHANLSIAPLVEAEQVKGAILLFVDISKRIHAVEALEIADKHRKALLEAIPDLLLRIDKKGAILDIIGTPEHKLINLFQDEEHQHLKDLISKAEYQELQAGIKIALDSSAEQIMEFKLQDLIIEVRLVMSRSGDLLLILRDITDEKKNQAEMVASLAESEKSDSDKTQLMSNLAYEFLVPLNEVVGNINLIEQSLDTHIGRAEQEYFSIVHAANRNLMRMVHELNDIISVDADNLNPLIEDMDLKALIESIIGDQKAEADERDLDLVLNVDPADYMIRGDRLMLQRACSHIIENALKYTLKGQVEILLSRDTKISCVIRDTGVGMSKAALANLFKMYTDQGDDRYQKYKGLGFGMPISKRYLDLNGVELKVDSKVNKGTKFTMLFEPGRKKGRPVSAITVSGGDSTAPQIVLERKPLILVVEDDANSQRLIRHFLKQDYGSCFAVSVSKAIQQLNKNHIDLVLLDISLQGEEDGLKLAEYIRRSKKRKNIPIIVTSAHTSVADQNRCVSIGCNEFLSKPIIKDVLLNKISKYFG